MFLALKELKKEKLRFGMILSVIVLITYLVYFLSSLAYGLAEINRSAVDVWHAEGIIASSSSNGNLYASTINESTFDVLKDADVSMINITNTNVYIGSDASAVSVVFMGYDLQDTRIPAPLIEGRGIQDDFEVIVSTTIREENRVELGDTITAADTGRIFTIVGFTQDANYNTRPVIYATRTMVSQMMMQYATGETSGDPQSSATANMPERISAFVVYDIQGLDEEVLKSSNVMYISIPEFIDALPGYQAQVLTFGLMIISLSLIASIIMGIFMYILTMQKRSVFAILKIQGYQNRYIIKSILIQILILTFLGIGVGFGLTYLTVLLMPGSVPVAFNEMLIILVSGFIVLTSLGGALFSARSVLKIDPLEAL